ncbi:MAG: glycosyltransferase, partial [Gammaproteobacteria bacterium]
AGVVVPFEDVDAAVKAILFLAENKELRRSFGKTAQKRVQRDHNSANAAVEILRHFKEEQNKMKAKKFSKKEPLVSVIVPNYNHAPFLTDRLKSIAQQTYHNIEIIVLDDCSSDSSREIIGKFLTQESRASAFFNEQNSGSPFLQWQKGIILASGKYIWIAESDDLADSNFLSKLVAPLESDPSIILATSQLYMINKKGEVGTTPMEWLSEFNSKRWDCDYTNNGIEEIKSFLSKKNTILNASGVVIRNIEGLSEMVDSTMRLCADWLLWIRLLEKGNIAYIAEPLNFWRIGTGNARNKKGMELELTEGPKIISEAGRILKWNAREITDAQDTFRARYQ